MRFTAVAIAPTAREALLAAAAAAYPREAVGVLGGEAQGGGALVQSFLPLPATATAAAFAVAPAHFAAAEAQLRAAGQQWLGFAHSHPDGSAALSQHDRATLWRDCVQLVLGCGADGRVQLAAYCLRGDHAVPLPLREAAAVATAAEGPP